MSESTIGINPGSSINTASLTDVNGNQVPKTVLSIDNGSQVATNVSSTNALPVTGTVTISTGGPYAVSQGTAANLNATVVNAAGTALMGQTISPATVTIYNGTAALTVQYASISFTSSAGNQIIAGVASKNIYVLSGLIVAQAATNLQFWSTSTAGTAISGVMACTANMGFQIPYVPIGNFVTQATGQAIQLSSSVAVTIGGWLTYVAY